MPAQLTLFGRPIRLAPRRVSLLLVAIGIFALFTLFFTLPSAIPTGPSLSKSIADHKPSIPKIPKLQDFKDTLSTSLLKPFKPAVHPPVQANSTDGESSWYSNWNWLRPFSSTITLDENRSLLPPLKERPRIYCYYDTTIQREKETKEAESALLLTWRRAWWAQGFKPIIIGAGEAMANPLYDELQRKEVEPKFKTNMMRWLAWENMGGGMLSDYLTLPMGSREEPLLTYLRRGEYPELTRWEGFGNGLYAGPKAKITDAVTKGLRNPEKKNAKDLIDAAPNDAFKIDKSHDGLAYYAPGVIDEKYPKVAAEIRQNRAAGFKALNLLINSHLHSTWQDLHHLGLSVLKPMPTHTTHMIAPALALADWLSQCGDTPEPSSCPPNLPKCSPCRASQPMKLSTPARYRNTSGLYHIGTVPHPYTLATLDSMKNDIDVAWVRREMDRDRWLYELTKEYLGVPLGGRGRILKFKEAVADEYATAHSVWLTAEHETLPHDLDWYFGFSIPVNGIDKGTAETPVPGPERRPKPAHDADDGPEPKEDELKLEPELLKRAREVGQSKLEKDVAVRNAIEAWNLADHEAWKFCRALLARTRVERLKWEEEESKYAEGAGSDHERKRTPWNRWLE
ncbi:hypothetical protein PG989_012526 [Apiospora arundinis]